MPLSCPSRGGSGWGWGPITRVQLAPYLLQYGFRLTQHFIVPEPQDAESCGRKHARSAVVSHGGLRMLASINLYDELPRDANEIQYVTPKRMLPPELEAT